MPTYGTYTLADYLNGKPHKKADAIAIQCETSAILNTLDTLADDNRVWLVASLWQYANLLHAEILRCGHTFGNAPSTERINLLLREFGRAQNEAEHIEFQNKWLVAAR